MKCGAGKIRKGRKCVKYGKVERVLKMMKRGGVDPEYASPNFVQSFAWNRGIRLSADEVVETSNKYEG